jgi:hypothetical protein
MRVGRVMVAAVVSLGMVVPALGSADRAGAAGTARVDVSDASVVEGDVGKPPLKFAVTLSGPAAVTVTMQYQTVVGTASAADFTAKSGTLTFKPGQVVKTVSVPVLADVLDEGDESFALQVSQITGADAGDVEGTGSIVDDDPGTGLRLAVGDARIVEGDVKNRAVKLVVGLSSKAPAPVTVDVVTIPGSAADTDFTVKPPTTLTFKTGQQFKTLGFPLRPDTLSEGDEQFGVWLTNPSGATIVDDRGMVTITDDEALVTPTSPLLASPGLGSAFYQPPDPLPVGRPGDVFWTSPDGSLAHGSVQRVLYRSRTVKGADTAVSGWIFTPSSPPPPGGYPVVTYGQGTLGLDDNCAQTKLFSPSGTPGGVYFDTLLANGYVVTTTDYEGLGTPDPATYLTAESEAHALLDSVRAARALNPSVSNRVVVYGLSQGGQAATAANQLAPYYAPDLQLLGGVGISSGVGLRDDVLGSLANSFYRGFAVMALRGFENAYPGTKVADYYLTAYGLSQLANTETDCGPAVVSAFSTIPAAQLFEAGALTTPPSLPAPTTTQAKTLDRAWIDHRPLSAPMLYLHGTADEILDPVLVPPFVQRMCDLGGTTELRWFAGQTHVGLLDVIGSDLVNYIADRFNGQPASSSCDAIPQP